MRVVAHSETTDVEQNAFVVIVERFEYFLLTRERVRETEFGHRVFLSSYPLKRVLDEDACHTITHRTSYEVLSKPDVTGRSSRRPFADDDVGGSFFGFFAFLLAGLYVKVETPNTVLYALGAGSYPVFVF